MPYHTKSSNKKQPAGKGSKAMKDKMARLRAMKGKGKKSKKK